MAYIYVNQTKIKFRFSELLQCIHNTKSLYGLRNGMGDISVVNTLSAQENGDIRFSALSLAPSMTSLDYNWIRNLTENVPDNNFLVYTNSWYKQNRLGLINSKIPSLNYKEVNCGSDTGIIIFDPKTTSYIDKFRRDEFENSKSWFYITNYSIGQYLWSKMPWNTDFIKAHHEFNYFGSSLNRTSQNAYQVADDLSIEVSGDQTGSVLMSEWTRAGKGEYYIKIRYASYATIANLIVYNGFTGQHILNKQLPIDTNYAVMYFNLDTPTLIAFTIDLVSQSSHFTLHEIKLGKS